jgi:hypothetical protein
MVGPPARKPRPPVARGRVVDAPATAGDPMTVVLVNYSPAWKFDVPASNWMPAAGDNSPPPATCASCSSTTTATPGCPCVRTRDLMADIPHFRHPFTRSPSGRVAVVEQDTPEHVQSCQNVIVRCPTGFREERPEFGWPFPEFRTAPLDLTELAVALRRFEPRAQHVTRRGVGRRR